MRPSKVKQIVERLHSAFLVTLENDALDTRDKVKLKFEASFCEHGNFNLEFCASAPTSAPIWDILKLAKDVEIVVPNVRVTAIQVAFPGRFILFTCKELGKKGTYHIKLNQEKR